MKRVLILAYDFPPFVSVGGLRPDSWYKYFHEFGIYPILVTRQWENKYQNHLDYIAPSQSDETIIEADEKGTLIRTPYSPNLANRIMLKYGDSKFVLVRKLITAFFEISQWFLPIGPKYTLYRTADDYIKTNRVDCIIATGDPFILFKYANQLSKDHQIPWIADYRDLWSQDLGLNNSPIYRKLMAFFEKRIVSKATVILVVNQFLKEEINRLIPEKKIELILNGFDPAYIEAARRLPQEDKVFSIGYAGSLYDWHPIESFLSALNKFIQKYPAKKIVVNFYGSNRPETIEDIKENVFPALKEIVRLIPRLSNKALLEQLAKNHLLLLFNDYYINGTKIYDYIGIQRKILFCYTQDERTISIAEQILNREDIRQKKHNLQSQFIEETNSGILIKDEDALLLALESQYEIFDSLKQVPCNSSNIDQFSRKRQIKNLAEIINQLNEGSH